MARTIRGSAFRGISVSERSRRLKSILCTTTILATAPLIAAADPLPTGGQVASGDVSIATPDSATMTINQGSNRAVVNWQSFDIGTGASVDIRQPGRDSAILNRVTGATDSRIHGRLTANGQVHIVNPNGILIGKDGVVETGGGFVASTLNISDDDFNAGRLTFGGTGASESITNRGSITVGQGGYAALLGGRVDNAGTITVPLGRIGLAAGERVTLDVSGDGFLQVALPSDNDGDDSALIKNSGKVSAEGGRIEIKAATARNAARNAINLSGVAEARSVSVRNGAIVLGGGSGGAVRVSGRVTTRAPKPRIIAPSVTVESSPRPQTRPKGGVIDITGARIAMDGAQIDASGDGGGGLVRIGGDFAGLGALPHAEFVTGDEGTLITANALNLGDGGRVVLWSDLGTTFAGRIEARGGAENGNGGFVEVSSMGDLSYAGLTDTRASHGAWGTLLLDPTDISVPGTVTEATVEANLALGNFTLDTTSAGSDLGDIAILAPIDWTAPTTFELLADNDIAISRRISGVNGRFVLNAAGTITLAPIDVGVTAIPSTITVADLVLAAPTINVSNGTVTETGSGGSVTTANFNMIGGAWRQVNGTLSPFSATDFRLFGTSASFLRTTGGTGASADPYIIEDVYGLQGMDSFDLLASDFALGDTIDASGTRFWDDFGEGFAGFDPIGDDSIGGFSGTLDGRGNAIDGLYVDRGTAGLFEFTDGAEIRNLDITNADINASFEGGVLGGFTIDTIIDGVNATGTVTGNTAERLGGLLAQNLISDLSNASFSGTITSNGSSGATKSIGGLVGWNLDSTMDTVSFDGTINANGSIPGGASITRNIGGIVGDNEGDLSNATASGTIVVGGSGDTHAGGLVGRNDGAPGSPTIFDSQSSVNLTLTMAGGDPLDAGGAVGQAFGDVTRTRATGSITASGFSAPNMGAFVGQNLGTITDSDAFGSVTYTTPATDPPGGFANVGGFAGLNSGTLERTGAHGAVTSTSSYLPSRIGGHTGSNVSGTILDGYALGNVTTDTTVFENTGGFAGRTQNGSIDNVFASGAVSAAGTFASAGGLIGINVFTDDVTFDPTTSVTQSFWDLDTTGQTPGTRAGYGTPINTTDFEDTAGFIVRGDTTNWDFANVWAPGDTGFYPQIYSIDQVIFARPDPVTLQYGTTPTASTTGTVAGGPSDYVFPPASDTLDSSPVFSDLVFPDENVGTGAFTLATTSLTSGLGETYRVVDLPAAYEITPAPLTITANDAVKTYGTELTFAGTEFTNSTLFFSDTISSVTLSSDGAFADATVPGGPYAIDPVAAVGTGLANYSITYAPGTLTVNTASASILIDDRSKTYGEALVLGSAAFGTSGFLFADFVDSVILASDGAVASAPVSGSPYAITGSLASGSGIENYNITFVPGNLTVLPAPLAITALDRSKTYGETIVFDAGEGTDFAVSGLLFDDAVTSVNVASSGAAGTAPVSGSPYTVTADGAAGTGLGNYDISYGDGVLAVDPAPLTVTANDQTKTFGDLFLFDGTEFTTSGLVVSGDSVDSASLVSLGAPRSALVSGNPFAIDISDATGSGLENYDIAYETGFMTVVDTSEDFIPRPPLSIGIDLPNPPDTIQLTLGLSGTTTPGASSQGAGTGTTQVVLTPRVGQAEQTLAVVEEIAGTLEIAADSCAQSDADVTRYLACLSDALNDFANKLDEIATDLPPGMENVASIVQDARRSIDASRARATQRLATATTAAERAAIRRDAINEARTAIDTASTEIRKAISFVRADDPELASIQTQTITRVAAAVDSVGIELSRAVGL